tara:strand:- start:182 stop:325 length:144 start_codon:yes stop_codon:yes gene_type:complete
MIGPVSGNRTTKNNRQPVHCRLFGDELKVGNEYDFFFHYRSTAQGVN